jgi:hydroxymethylbilane synthase
MATGSLRRRSQLLAARPDLHIEDLRGNVQTRLSKFDASSWEAIVLAGAGLVRLGLEARIRSYFSVDEMIPAVGQGALALETRADDHALRDRLRELNHPASESAVLAERVFLGRLQGGCQVPIGAYGEIEGGELRLRGFVGAVDGSRYEKRERSGPVAAAQELGLALAEDMLAAGASEIIQQRSEVDG